MSGRGALRRRVGPPAALVLMLAALTGGCGDPGEDAGAARAETARAYATAVGTITRDAGTALAAISTDADYRDAPAAAATTRRYAAIVRRAATALQATRAPQDVAAAHRDLAGLYRTTADRMEALAAGFAEARGTRALTEQARALSTEVQRYSTRERALRAAIERRLAAAVGETTPPAAPGDDGLGAPEAGGGEG